MLPGQTGGATVPDSNWASAGKLVAGDAIGTANRVEGVKVSIPKGLRFRRLYVAGFTIPNYRTGYAATASLDARFVLCFKSEQTEFMRVEWGNDNSPGVAWPTSTNYVDNPNALRPQFRVSNRQQQQTYGVGWAEPMMKDGMEILFRTQDAAPGPTALEWLISCAPWSFNASITEITLDAERSILVTPDQLGFFVGCLSSDTPI